LSIINSYNSGKTITEESGW